MHNQVAELLSAYIDGEVSAAERALVERHLATCPTCTRDLAALRQTVQLLRQLPVVATPRAFTLRESQVRSNRPQVWRWLFGVPALAGGVVALLCVVTVGGVVLLSRMAPGVAEMPLARAPAPTPVALVEPRRETTTIAAPATATPEPTQAIEPPAEADTVMATLSPPPAAEDVSASVSQPPTDRAPIEEGPPAFQLAETEGAPTAAPSPTPEAVLAPPAAEVLPPAPAVEPVPEQATPPSESVPSAAVAPVLAPTEAPATVFAPAAPTEEAPTAAATPLPPTATLPPVTTTIAEPTVTGTSEPLLASAAEPTATETSEPAAAATSTPEPTATATAEPTATPTSTATAEPTATPMPEPTLIEAAPEAAPTTTEVAADAARLEPEPATSEPPAEEAPVTAAPAAKEEVSAPATGEAVSANTPLPEVGQPEATATAEPTATPIPMEIEELRLSVKPGIIRVTGRLPLPEGQPLDAAVWRADERLEWSLSPPKEGAVAVQAEGRFELMLRAEPDSPDYDLFALPPDRYEVRIYPLDMPVAHEARVAFDTFPPTPEPK